MEENLLLYGRLFCLPDLRERVAERLMAMDLKDRAKVPVGELSRGFKQRVALARALLHDPDVVLLDEPYTGLDAYAATLLREELRSLKDGQRTVVLVTHNLAEGLELADLVAIQVRGRFVALEDRGDFNVDRFEAFYRSIVEETR